MITRGRGAALRPVLLGSWASLLLALLALALCPARAQAAARINYRVDLHAHATEMVTVTAEITDAPAPLTLIFPAWLPGAYELRYFGREVRQLDAEASGQSLHVHRGGLTRFIIEGHAKGARVVVRYEMAAALLSDDGAEVSAAHAYLNPGAILPLVHGLEEVEHALIIEGLPTGWRVVAALEGEPTRGLVAPSYLSLIDGPIEAAPSEALSVSSRMLGGARFTVVLHEDGRSRALAPPPALWPDLERLIEAERALAGALPYARYLLLVHVSERPERAIALEHAASTSVLVPHSWLEGEGYAELRQMIAHELFHAWNARRLVPAALTRWDPEQAQASPELWITEGLTEHAALVAQTQAGFRSITALAQALSLALSRAKRAERSALSLEELSQLAFCPPTSCKDDPDAYYAMGQVVSLALTAELLLRTDGRVGLSELLAALLPQPGAPPRSIDRALLGRTLDALAPPSTPALSTTLGRWVKERYSLAALLPSLEALGLRVTQRRDEHGEPLVLVEPASLNGPLPPALRAKRARLLGLSPRPPR